MESALSAHGPRPSSRTTQELVRIAAPGTGMRDGLIKPVADG